jgi:hypothetical protein
MIFFGKHTNIIATSSRAAQTATDLSYEANVTQSELCDQPDYKIDRKPLMMHERRRLGFE